MGFSVDDRWKRRLEWVWAPALYVAVVLLLYRTLWLGEHGRLQWFGWDCIESYWPDLAYFARGLRAGEWPLWNPYDRGGYAFYGDTVIGLYYPGSWLFVAPGALLGGMPPWTIEVKVILHLALAGTLMHAFLRSLRLSRTTAAFGGVVTIASTPLIIHKASALLWPMVFAPLLWLAIDRVTSRTDRPGGWWRGAALGGAIGLAGLSGPPPGFFYILLPTAAYALLRVVQRLREGPFRDEARRLAIAFGVAAAVAMALLLITVVPAGAVVAESPRGARTLQYALNTALPIGPGTRGLFVPSAGMVDPYLGLAPLLLAAVTLATRPRVARWQPVLFAGVALFAFLLVLGGGTPILPWLVKHVPGFGLFREPNRYKCMMALCVPVVAAHGFEAFLAAEPNERRRLLYALGGATAVYATLLVAFAAAHPKVPPHLPRYAYYGLILALVAGGAAACLFLPARLRPIVGIAVIAVAFIDVAVCADAFVRAREAPPDDRADLRWLDGLADVTREWRVYDEYVMEQRPGSRLGVRDFRGYPSGDPFEDVRYQEVLKLAGRSPEILEAFNVRYVLHGAHHRNGKSKNYVQAPPRGPHFRALDARRFEAAHPVPLVAWYGAVQILPRAKILQAMLADEDPNGVRRHAFVDPGEIPAELAPRVAALAAAAPQPSVGGHVLAYRGNRIETEITAPAAGMVVLNEKQFAGWQVTVDGQAGVPMRANHLLRAVLVEAGPHRVVWEFRPRRFGALAFLWAAGVAFLAVAATFSLRARRRAR